MIASKSNDESPSRDSLIPASSVIGTVFSNIVRVFLPKHFPGKSKPSLLMRMLVKQTNDLKSRNFMIDQIKTPFRLVFYLQFAKSVLLESSRYPINDQLSSTTCFLYSSKKLKDKRISDVRMLVEIDDGDVQQREIHSNLFASELDDHVSEI
ncbi:hypothetical protein BC833DRAFT_662208 [Globomyces pollinis-pini]|nr:hypothetical protein BC833DRAFT_662208 [Globomyces pollinis-pini]